MEYQKAEFGTPFNMAIANLESLNEIFKNIIRVSSNQSLDPNNPILLTTGQAQHIKYRLVRQLYIHSRALINNEKNESFIEDMDERVFEFEKELKLVQKYDINKNQIVGVQEHYNPDFEIILDKTIMEIRDRLQSEGIFMPPKSDPRFAFSQR